MVTTPIGLKPGCRALAMRALLAILFLPFVAAHAGADERRIELYNIHTKENISIVYKRDGKYIPEAMEKLNYFMRDWRRNKATEMDPELIDLVWEIHKELGSRKPVHLISGHRSDATNEQLRKTRGGQARKSKHISGEAADIHFPDISVKQLRNSALIRERGGVGYYPTSSIPFVHVDTGRVRHWPRLQRQELAILFPSGKSQHVPTDGKPLTKRDFQVALANLQSRGGELPIALQRRLDNGGNGRVVLASAAPAKSPTEVTIVPAPEKEPKPRMILASLTPFAGIPDSAPARKPDVLQPAVRTGTQQTAASADADIFRRDFLANTPTDTVPEDQMAAAPEYDDDHPDEFYYQPFPILPFMADTPIASMDMTGDDALSLAKVHMMFAEAREMYHIQFQPGLQYAQLYWAQSFRGTAVNTKLKRLAREDAPEPVPTAQTAQPVKTARK
ncbi:MAG: DUF882 domain-containing protein [Rhodomicrobium sp.]|nr:DUF882 domain-containing protein [Rhodomicrobium sp.]